MKVKVIQNYVDLKIDDEYYVLGLNISLQPNETYCLIKPKNVDYPLIYPLSLFKILENSHSKIWKLFIYENEDGLSFWPEILEEDFLIERLSEGEPELLESFNKVYNFILYENKS